MTRFIKDDGTNIPVTVIQAGPCAVTQVKTIETDGYSAVQLAYEDVKPRNSTMPVIGHDAKAGVSPKKFHREVRLVGPEASERARDGVVGADGRGLDVHRGHVERARRMPRRALQDLHADGGVGAGVAHHARLDRGELSLRVAPRPVLHADGMPLGVHQERLLAAWGDLLGQFAVERGVVSHLSWSDLARPSGMGDHITWLDSDQRGNPVPGAAESYRELLEDGTLWNW